MYTLLQDHFAVFLLQVKLRNVTWRLRSAVTGTMKRVIESSEETLGFTAFCNSSPPTVSYSYSIILKTEYVPVLVLVHGHVKAEWEHLTHSDWRSFLIFQQVLRSDSGGGRGSHDITVYVEGQKHFLYVI